MGIKKNKFSFCMLIFLLFLQMHSVLALYEDEIGKHDWTRQFVGRVQHLEFDLPAGTTTKQRSQQLQGGSSSRRLFVATDHNVLAAIGLKSSRIIWRHFLEDAPVNGIKLCDGALFSMSNGLLRSWSTSRGILNYEISVQEQLEAKFAGTLTCHEDPDDDRSLVFASTARRLVAVAPLTGALEWAANLDAGSGENHSEVTSFPNPDGLTVVTFDPTAGKMRLHQFGAESGVAKRTATVKAEWLTSLQRCAISVSTLACLDPAGSVRLLSLSSGSDFKPLPPSLVEQLGHAGPWQSVEEIGGQDLFQLTTNSGAVVAMLDASLATGPTGESLPAGSLLRYRGQVRFLLRQQGDGGGGVTLEASSSSSLVASNKISLSFASHHGRVSQLYPVTFVRKGGSSYGYRVVMTTRDADLHAFDDTGERQWMREESLAGIVSVEAVDLPSADEDELVTPGGSVFSSFAQRLSGQVHHFIHVLQHLMLCWRARPASQADSLGEFGYPDEAPAPPASAASSSGSGAGSLIRDEFNLHKLLVVATKDGKLAALDSATGRSVWRLMIPMPAAAAAAEGTAADSARTEARIEPLAGGQMPLYIQRTTAHFPLEPMATVLCRDSSTGRPVLFSFNPITGIGIGLAQRLQSRLLQALLVPQPSHDNGQYIRPLMLLSDTLQVTLYPAKTALPHGFKSLNLYTVDRDNRLLQGYRLRLTEQQQQMSAISTWRLALHEPILVTAARRPTEQVHSVGRVLGNRHVLYKYLNPNLLAVATLAKDMVTPAPQIGDAYTQITIWLIDTVSGRVVASATHHHSSGPVSLVHSEHWLVYSLWNQKQRRFQLSVWELFAGNGLRDCMNATQPIVGKQSYILPAPVQHLAVSQTERGITAKSVLLALRSGGIMELSKAFLDPRRPFDMTPEFQEEGLMPYHPEVPMSTQAIVNYNQSLHRVEGMVTVPTGLESTSLLFVHGTDLFCTRVQPSKMFDVLKADFDYAFIAAVTIGMIIGSFVTQRLAARKALFRLWS
ncbi:hypothetical protein BOX15_Mlig023688g2 [Macrostomum lignano]|uniref:ER membrane protein complex subunit 1 n=2 Tax=Macrostomum lignano TaxID=282301 RepID=A0A267H533_9PLAT|nr:hypothetical protein BOX15_Mlig023688g2 [Macrostomum lignano]